MDAPLGQLAYCPSLTRGVAPVCGFTIYPVGKIGQVVGLVATEEIARCLCEAWNARHLSQPATDGFKLTP